MISLGIVLCTIMSAKDVKTEVSEKSDGDASPQEETNESWEMLLWMIGISMLTFALFLSARMGIYQEEIYAKYGKYPMEALFYSVSYKLTTM